MLISWHPNNGSYLHTCDECGQEFLGRKNKLYCNDKCKAKHNNELAAHKREDEKSIMQSAVRNVDIIKAELGGLENEVISRSKEPLLAKGFDPQAPSTRVLLNGEAWFTVGGYAYRSVDDNEIELYKLPNHE